MEFKMDLNMDNNTTKAFMAVGGMTAGTVIAGMIIDHFTSKNGKNIYKGPVVIKGGNGSSLEFGRKTIKAKKDGWREIKTPDGKIIYEKQIPGFNKMQYMDLEGNPTDKNGNRL